MKRVILKRLMLLGIVFGSVAALASSAEAGDRYRWRSHWGHGHHGHYHSGYGHRYHYGSHWHPTWHDTTHWDYHPGGFYRHGNHYHYQPGHYHLHRSGHWDWYHHH